MVQSDLCQVTTKPAVCENNIVEAAESSDLTNAALIGAALDLARLAMANGNKQFVTRTTLAKQAAQWLRSVELAEGNYLLPAATTAVTTISNPMHVSNSSTAYGARQTLLKGNWTLAKSGRDASVASRKLHPRQCVWLTTC